MATANEHLISSTSLVAVTPGATDLPDHYPGSGLSYVDPRGRTWTLSAAGAIVTPP